MTPEERFNQDVWLILQEIKEKYLALSKNQPPQPENEYLGIYADNTKPYGVEICIKPGDKFSQQGNIIYKLQEWEMIKVLRDVLGDLSYEGRIFILDILQPKFDEIYGRIEKTYQERVVDPVAIDYQKTTSEKGIGYFLFRNKKIEIGPDDTVPFKLLDSLIPLGRARNIDAVFSVTNTGKSKHKNDRMINFGEKREILRHRIKELQEVLGKSKIKVRLRFDEIGKNVSLEYKSG